MNNPILTKTDRFVIRRVLEDAIKETERALEGSPDTPSSIRASAGMWKDTLKAVLEKLKED
jgi:hypothetical protein